MTSQLLDVAPDRAGRVSRRHRRLRLMVTVEILVPLLVIVGLIVWTSASGVFYFPPLANVLLDFPQTWFVEKFQSDVLPSLARLGAGFAIAVAVGVPTGLVLGRLAYVRAFIAPPLEFLRATPAPAMIPLVILLIGIGDDAKIALIAAVCVWPIFLNAMDGAAGAEPAYLETATVFGVSRPRQFVRIILPAALPQLFAGFRVALALGLIMIVVSEMAASQNGIGFVILISQRTFALSDMWSGIILLGILGYLLNLLLELAERRIIAWHRGSRSQPE